MSVDAVRKLVEGRGCCGFIVTAVSVLIAAAFVIPGACGRSMQMQNAGRPAESRVVAKLGTYTLLAQYLEEALKRQTGQATASQEASEIGFALKRLLDGGYALNLANKKNVNLSDQTITSSVTGQINDQLDMIKAQAQQMGRYKGKTDADFDAFLKESQGADRAGLTEKVLTNLKQRLANSTERSQVVSEMAMQALVTQASAKLNISDDDVKKQFRVYETKRVFVRFTGTDDAKAKELAAKASAEAKAGATFESVMDKYSGDTPDPGKKASESKSTVSGSMVLTTPAYKPIGALKAGEITEPLKLEGGYAVYKLISFKDDVPKDFEQSRPRYVKSLANNIAQREVDDEINQLKKDLKPTWESKGYELLYRLVEMQMDRQSQGVMQKQWEAIEKEATDASNDPVGEKAAALAKYIAVTEQLAGADAKAKAELQPRHADALVQVLKFTEGVDLRLELVDTLKDLKKGEEASEALLEAAKNNNDVEMRGQTYFNMINAKKAALKESKLLSPDVEQAIDKEQQRWKSERADKDKAEEDRKKEEAAERKKAEVEKKKADLEKLNVKPKARDLSKGTP